MFKLLPEVVQDCLSWALNALHLIVPTEIRSKIPTDFLGSGISLMLSSFSRLTKLHLSSCIPHFFYSNWSPALSFP